MQSVCLIPWNHLDDIVESFDAKRLRMPPTTAAAFHLDLPFLAHQSQRQQTRSLLDVVLSQAQRVDRDDADHNNHSSNSSSFWSACIAPFSARRRFRECVKTVIRQIRAERTSEREEQQLRFAGAPATPRLFGLLRRCHGSKSMATALLRQLLQLLCASSAAGFVLRRNTPALVALSREGLALFVTLLRLYITAERADEPGSIADCAAALIVLCLYRGVELSAHDARIITVLAQKQHHLAAAPLSILGEWLRACPHDAAECLIVAPPERSVLAAALSASLHGNRQLLCWRVVHNATRAVHAVLRSSLQEDAGDDDDENRALERVLLAPLAEIINVVSGDRRAYLVEADDEHEAVFAVLGALEAASGLLPSLCGVRIDVCGAMHLAAASPAFAELALRTIPPLSSARDNAAGAPAFAFSFDAQSDSAVLSSTLALLPSQQKLNGSFATRPFCARALLFALSHTRGMASPLDVLALFCDLLPESEQLPHFCDLIEQCAELLVNVHVDAPAQLDAALEQRLLLCGDTRRLLSYFEFGAAGSDSAASVAANILRQKLDAADEAAAARNADAQRSHVAKELVRCILASAQEEKAAQQARQQNEEQQKQQQQQEAGKIAAATAAAEKRQRLLSRTETEARHLIFVEELECKLLLLLPLTQWRNVEPVATVASAVVAAAAPPSGHVSRVRMLRSENGRSNDNNGNEDEEDVGGGEEAVVAATSTSDECVEGASPIRSPVNVDGGGEIAAAAANLGLNDTTLRDMSLVSNDFTQEASAAEAADAEVLPGEAQRSQPLVVAGTGMAAVRRTSSSASSSALLQWQLEQQQVALAATPNTADNGGAAAAAAISSSSSGTFAEREIVLLRADTIEELRDGLLLERLLLQRERAETRRLTAELSDELRNLQRLVDAHSAECYHSLQYGNASRMLQEEQTLLAASRSKTKDSECRVLRTLLARRSAALLELDAGLAMQASLSRPMRALIHTLNARAQAQGEEIERLQTRLREVEETAAKRARKIDALRLAENDEMQRKIAALERECARLHAQQQTQDGGGNSSSRRASRVSVVMSSSSFGSPRGGATAGAVVASSPRGSRIAFDDI